MNDRLFVGTAGWSIPSQYRPEFPDAGSHLERYAARFNAVEINSSFYRPHRRATYERWAASVPARFRFSVKLPRTMTHHQRLIGCDSLLEAFTGEVRGLGDKLAVLLVQLPPSLAFDPAIADTFFAALRSAFAAPVALVCEPRHPSWFRQAPENVMTAHRIARVAADPAPVPAAARPGGWPGLRYLRLHGSPVVYRSAYGTERLLDYAANLASEDSPAWHIFDNTAQMAATGDALLFRRLIETRRHPERPLPPIVKPHRHGGERL